MGMCSGVLYDLEMGCPNARRIHLVDEDGESIFIRAGNLAMLDIPLWVLEPLCVDGDN